MSAEQPVSAPEAVLPVRNGPLSIACPLAVLGFYRVAGFLPKEALSNPWAEFLMIAPFFGFVVGLGYAIKGMIHPERLRWLPAIGFGFNLILIAWSFLA
jgi:hypothetical protein